MRISFQQFVVATTGRRREQQHESNIEGRHLERKHEVKEAHAVEERAGIEYKEFGMIQARQQRPKNYVVLMQQSA